MGIESRDRGRVKVVFVAADAVALVEPYVGAASGYDCLLTLKSGRVIGCAQEADVVRRRIEKELEPKA